MRDYDDNIRLYTPVLQRIIILVAIIVAVPVMLWTITAFVRSYVGPPRGPTFQRMATASVATSDETARTDAPLPDAAEARATPTDVRTTLLEFRKPAAAADQAPAAAQPAPTAPQARTPAPAPAISAPQIAATTPANTAPTAADKTDRVGALPATATPTAAPAPPARADFAWPSPPPVPPPAPDTSGDNQTAVTPQDSSDAMPAAAPISGPIPLPRRRPTLYAMAQGGASSAGIPVPRPRPQAAGPAVTDTPPGPLDWLGKLFQPQPQASPQNP
jgi:hypothetical protein